MADSVAAGTLFAFLRNWAGALGCIAAVGLNLPE
jgi:hypothetical protein